MQQQTNNHTIFAQFLSFRNEYKQVANDTIPLDSNQWQQEYLHFVQFERAMLENNITTAATMALRVQAYAEFVQLNGNNFFQQVQNAQIASAPAEATNATSDTIVATPVHQQESNAIERQVHVIEDDSDSGTEPIQGRKRQLSSDDDDDEESEQVQAPIRKKRRSERVSQQEPVSYHEQKVTYVKVDGIQIGNDILVLSNEVQLRIDVRYCLLCYMLRNRAIFTNMCDLICGNTP